MKVESKIVKVGNANYINIPAKILKALEKEVGDKIVVEIKIK